MAVERGGMEGQAHAGEEGQGHGAEADLGHGSESEEELGHGAESEEELMELQAVVKVESVEQEVESRVELKAHQEEWAWQAELDDMEAQAGLEDQWQPSWMRQGAQWVQKQLLSHKNSAQPRHTAVQKPPLSEQTPWAEHQELAPELGPWRHQLHQRGICQA